MPDPSTLAARELDAAVLVAIRGWRWMRDKKRNLCALHPPEPYDFDAQTPDVWLPTNYAPEFWEPVVGVPCRKERFSDWHRAATRTTANGEWRCGIPSPSTNAKDMFDVLAKWDGSLRISRDYDVWRCILWSSIGHEYTELGETPMLAACRAILKAMAKP